MNTSVSFILRSAPEARVTKDAGPALASFVTPGCAGLLRMKERAQFCFDEVMNGEGLMKGKTGASHA